MPVDAGAEGGGWGERGEGAVTIYGYCGRFRARVAPGLGEEGASAQPRSEQ